MTSTSEKFFVQRLLELLHRETIDSYRVRVLNPLLALRELLKVYEGLVQGSVKNFETLNMCIAETLFLLKEDNTVIFQSVQKKFFEVEVLRKINKDNFEFLFSDTRYVIKTIIKENHQYAENVKTALQGVIEEPLGEDPFPQLDRIYRLTGILATELLHFGYDKGFLYSLCYRLFLIDPSEYFQNSFNRFSNLLVSEKTDYQVWFKVYAPGLEISDWPEFPQWEIQTSLIDLAKEIKPKIHSFLDEKRGRFFVGSQFQARDHFSALRLAKQNLAEALDLIGLAHHQRKIELHATALVYPGDRPKFADLQKVQYIHDGKFPSGGGVLDQLQQKTPAILDNPEIYPETKEKVKSALRYLRYGNESLELEHQLVNYWIGLEYLFSNDRDSTFTRIKTIFPVLQALVYIQRNFRDFHSILCQIEGITKLPHFSADNTSCIMEQRCLESIRDELYLEHPLIAYRAWKILNRLLLMKDGARQYIQTHRMHLEWHLARIYRERNEVVHEAKHSFNNQILTSNLRYYLAFSLSMVIDYFSKSSPDARSVDEFFSFQQLHYRSLEFQGFPLEIMLNLDHNFELLS
jgi:hypothetical protein